MKEAYIIDGVRTPIGNYKGTLGAVRTDDLGALVIKEVAAKNASIPLEAYDDVIMGCANQAGEDPSPCPVKQSTDCAAADSQPLSTPIERLNPETEMCSSLEG